MIFFTADPYFGHENIFIMCNRSFQNRGKMIGQDFEYEKNG